MVVASRRRAQDASNRLLAAKLRGAAFAALLLTTTAQAPAQHGGLTVTEAVQTEYYVDPASGLPIAGESATGKLFPFSPDGRRAIYVTRRADLARDRTIYALHLVEAQGAGRAPSSRIIATMASASNRPGISQLSWLDDGHIGFVGEGEDGHPQIFTTDLAGTLTRHTSDAAEKTGYSVGGDGTILYGEIQPLGTTGAMRDNGYVIGDRTLADILNLSSGDWRRRIAYRAIIGGKTVKLDGLPSPYSMVPPFVSVSPSGRYAVVATAPATIPARWEGMNYLMSLDTGGAPRSHHQELTLVDLGSGENFRIGGGPISQPMNGTQILWDEANDRIFGFDQFVDHGPPGGATPDRSHPWIFEYSLKRHDIAAIIAAGPAPANMVRDDLVLAADIHGSTLEIVRRSGRQRFVAARGAWRPAPLTSAAATNARAFALDVDQALDRPPQLVATLKGGRRKWPVGPVLNPATREAMAPGRLFEWTDKDGKTWQGDLILPAGTTTGQKLPLIIETHTFRPKEFVINGPFASSAGFAAQALVRAGFAVLVTGYRYQEHYGPQEFEIVTEGYRSAIEELAAKGIIDSARVGAIGWSRSGFWLQRALSYRPDLFAAASVSDASSFGSFQYMFFQNWPGYQDDFVVQSGTTPFGEGRAIWSERDPVSRVKSFTTPLRIDKYGEWPSWWEPYSAMRTNKQPVEYFHIPTAAHDPRIPRHQLTIQSQTVDWFRFWLLGRKNPAPLLADQYERWDKLCAQLSAQRPNPPCAQAEAIPVP